MSLDPELVEEIRELDEHELRRVFMLARARLESHGVIVEGNRENVKFRQQSVKCGKSNCGTCPHGPYWYAYWWEDGRRRSLYVGKLPEGEIPTETTVF